MKIHGTIAVIDGKTNWVKTTREGGEIHIIGFTNPLAAEHAAQAMKMLENDSGPVTLNEFLDRWIEHHVLVQLSRDTAQEYMLRARRDLRPLLGDVLLHEVTEDHIANMYRTIMEAGTKQSADRTLVVLRSALNKAVDWTYLGWNPLRGLTKKTKPQKGKDAA